MYLSLLAPKVVWGIVAVWGIVVAVVGGFFWLLNARGVERQRKVCDEKKCKYFTDYLERGPADLRHTPIPRGAQFLQLVERMAGV